ncbi:MAG TPA: hypothetical protein DCG34_07770 [Clostridiales bacterium]|jgi:hypothetical protein|nr:hypothetical protein [Clostridiales bacterium]
MHKEHIDINGISLSIIDTEFFRKHEQIIKKCQYLVEPLGNDKHLLLTNLTTKKLLQAAGHDLSKIDFAVPQHWLDQDDIHHRYYQQNDQAVWSYENNQWGEPVWSSEAWKEMLINVRAHPYVMSSGQSLENPITEGVVLH